MITIRKHEDIIVIIVIWLLFFAVLLFCHIKWNYTNNIIHNPTFIGTVVGAESTTKLVTRIWKVPVHRLHIIGEYLEGDEIIQVDRVFVVSAEIFYQFEEGDTISFKQR